MPTIHVYWSRRDFRLTDNPALASAVQAAEQDGGYVLPCFVLEDYMRKAEPEHQFGYPQRLFLAHALPAFAAQFSQFFLFQGKAARTIRKLGSHLKQQGYDTRVYVNEDVYPDFYTQVQKLKRAQVDIVVYRDQLTIPHETRSGSGGLYSIFTPFKKMVWRDFLRKPVGKSVSVSALQALPAACLAGFQADLPLTQEAILAACSSARILELPGKRVHKIDLNHVIPFTPDITGWPISEREAQDQFHSYLETGLSSYAETRDSLERDVTGGGTSRMSVALTWGLVSGRWLRQGIQEQFDTDFSDINWFKLPESLASPVQYLSELVWREFYKYLFFHHPELLTQEFQERFRGTIQWVPEHEALHRFTAWMTGMTGYPVVDAAMMQLAKTGWMHNRSRMIVASVLTKNLGVDWRWGQEYFRAQLIDLDEASNNGGWQWGASVGADPKPIRIFNPSLQAKNYDASGAYRRHWLGEERLKAELPLPIVPHEVARREALRRYGMSKDGPVRDF